MSYFSLGWIGYLGFLTCAFANSTDVNKIGNGGYGVICGKGAATRAKLLDFYEQDPKLETQTIDPRAIAEARVLTLKAAAPKLAEQYVSRLRQVWSEIEFKSKVTLTEVRDSQHLFRPATADCRVLQLAIRRERPATNEKRFLVQKELWDALDPVQKAGLLTHEVIYEHFAKLGEKDSVKARRLNRYLFSSIESRADFWKTMQELEIPIYP